MKQFPKLLDKLENFVHCERVLYLFLLMYKSLVQLGLKVVNLKQDNVDKIYCCSW